MSDLKTEDISFKSSNGRNIVAAWAFTVPQVQPRAILQIAHGMCEYIGRYQDFAAFMAEHGFVVCGNDHLGHGRTSAGPQENGFFGPDGRQFVLEDMYQLNQQIRKKYPGLPVILLGHSMGSFFSRWFAAQHPEAIDALILSGTGGKNPAASAGIALTALIAKLKGPTYRSKLVDKMAFGSYLKKIQNPKTPYDWISSDEQIVAKYAADPMCTFTFTVNGFHEMLLVLREVSGSDWASRLKKETPVYLFAGDMDPVGNYGEGVKQVFGWIQDAGVQDVKLKLYENGRHEMLNEVECPQVYADVLAWCEAHIEKV